MDDILRKELLRKELKEKNKGKNTVACKYRVKIDVFVMLIERINKSNESK